MNGNHDEEIQVMDVKNELTQRLYFKDDEGINELKSIEVRFFNGSFQDFSFRIGESSYTFKYNLKALEELRKVLTAILEFPAVNATEVGELTKQRLSASHPIGSKTESKTSEGRMFRIE